MGLYLDLVLDFNIRSYQSESSTLALALLNLRRQFYKKSINSKWTPICTWTPSGSLLKGPLFSFCRGLNDHPFWTGDYLNRRVDSYRRTPVSSQFFTSRGGTLVPKMSMEAISSPHSVLL